MIKTTYPKIYRNMLIKSNISGFHLMLNLKESRNLATSKMIAYSIRAINMKKSDTNAKTVHDRSVGQVVPLLIVVPACIAPSRHAVGHDEKIVAQQLALFGQGLQ